jgi:hypothetical protein
VTTFSSQPDSVRIAPPRGAPETTPRSAAANAAARDLWARCAGDASAPEEVAAAAERMGAELSAVLGRWIGAEAYRVLLERALVLARTEHPALGGLSRLGGDGPGATAAVRAQGSDEVAAGLMALVSGLIELLGRIIGEEMAVRLVEQTAEAAKDRTRAEW